MFSLIATVLSAAVGVLIAYLRWQSSNSTYNKEAADENAKSAQLNANSSVSTVDDIVKQLRYRAKQKNSKS